jgi:glutamate synthase (NADPH/NADH) small chain
VCPTEILCEQACVRNTCEHTPVKIGALQRYSTDWLFENGIQLFSRAPETGRTVAVVGAGPAGLACAHALARLGHTVTVYDAKEKPGGLNEYGIAAYKVPEDFAQREIRYILELGGIDLQLGKALGRDITIEGLREDYDAVFLGLGLAGVSALKIPGEDVEGVEPAVDFIERLRQSRDLSGLPVGRRIVVIGGGNTAIDAATQSKLLGAEDVTLVYRRGRDRMSATPVEQEWAQTHGVRIKYNAQPVEILSEGGAVTGVRFEYTQTDGNGRLAGTGETMDIAADQVFTAIGQRFEPGPLGQGILEITGAGRLAVDRERRTTLPGVWAGGDGIDNGHDLTVAAVEDGKIAARSINEALMTAAEASPHPTVAQEA